MTINFYYTIFLTSGLLLTACQTTGTSNTNATNNGNNTGNNNQTPTVATATNLQQIYDNNIVIDVAGKKSIASKTGNKITYANQDNNFKLKKNKMGGFDIVVNGETRIATTEDPYGLGKTAPNGTFIALTLSDLLNVKTKGHLNIALDMQYGNMLISRKQLAADNFEFVNGAFGIETKQTNKLTASYNGGAHFNNNYVAALKLDANFTNATLNGKLDKFRQVVQRSANDGELYLKTGELLINNGKINNFKISGDLAGQIANKTITGTISGNIYGPNAQEVAGDINITNPIGDGTLQGGFIAK